MNLLGFSVLIECEVCDLCSQILYSFSMRCAVIIFHAFSVDPLQTSACSAPPSWGHLRPSCSPYVSFPFFLAFHFSCLTLTLILSAEQTFTKLVYFNTNQHSVSVKCDQFLKQNSGLVLVLSLGMCWAIYLLHWYALKDCAFSTVLYIPSLDFND